MEYMDTFLKAEEKTIEYIHGPNITNQKRQKSQGLVVDVTMISVNMCFTSLLPIHAHSYLKV